MNMKYGYARVSTKKQLAGNSIEDQIKLLQEQNCNKIIVEQYTGATTNRPKFELLVQSLKEGDTLIVTKLDRFARNVTEGIEIIRYLFSHKVKVYVLNVGLLEDTAMGNFFLTTLLAVAELERAMIYERTAAGREIARTKAGYKEGRPRINEDKLKLALELKKTHTYKEVEGLTGISKSSIIRYRHKKLAKALFK